MVLENTYKFGPQDVSQGASPTFAGLTLTGLSGVLKATAGVISGSTDLGFVDRGDPSAFDFSIGDLTTDATWRDLDLSSIIPAGAKAVLFSATVRDDDAANSVFQLREKGNSNTHNVAAIRTQAAAVTQELALIVVPDSDRKVQYKASNVTWNKIDLLVRGWWL